MESIIRKAAKSKYDANVTWEGDYLPAEELKKLVPSDPVLENVHVNWGQGMMVCGENPDFHPYTGAY